MQVNQNVPTCAVAGSNNGCRPNPAFANNNQYSSVGRSNFPRRACVVRPAAGEVGQLPGLVQPIPEVDEQLTGEAFFNPPIDPLRPGQGLGAYRTTTSVIRLAVSARSTRPMARRRQREALTNGFPAQLGCAVLLGAAVQHHHRDEHDSGTAARAGPSTASHTRARRRRHGLLDHQPACEPNVRLGSPRQGEGLDRGIHLFEIGAITSPV
jgi:hypothetical protein